jgi:hypothetical protein
MLVSNPRFGYFNLSGLGLGVSVQKLPRWGRKLSFDLSYELMNVTAFTFNPSNFGWDFGAATSLMELGFGELDIYGRYRLARILIDGVQVNQSTFDIGVGYRW